MFNNKRIFIVSCSLFFTLTKPVCAGPFFTEKSQDSIKIYIGQSIGTLSMHEIFAPGLWDFERMTFASVEYSQPGTFFRLPMRQTFSLSHNFDYADSSHKSFSMIGVSWDAALLTWNNLYFGMGIGPYYRDARDSRVASRLVFGEKMFFGYRWSEKIATELSYNHFSNGDFAAPNLGFNFLGIATIINF